MILRKLAGFLALAAAFSLPAEAATITVSNYSDIVDGDVSNPSSLAASPGPDGISFREALLAAIAAAGPHTIQFAPAVEGQTIAILSKLPVVTRPQITVQGPSLNGAPNVTLDVGGVPSNPGLNVIDIRASDITIASLRFIGIRDQQYAIRVRADAALGAPLVERVTIADSVFDQTIAAVTFPTAEPVSFVCDPGSLNGVIRDAQVLRSTFLRIVGDADAIHLQASGTNCRIENTLIQDNVVSDSNYPVELVTFQGAGNRISGTRILRNAFINSFQAISVGAGTGSVDGVITETLIAGNAISNSSNPAMQIIAAFSDGSGTALTDTVIAGNLLVNSGSGGGVSIVGNGGSGANNAISGLLFVNNTLVRGPGAAGLAVIANYSGSAVGSVSGVRVQNSIFQGAGDDFFGAITPADVSHSLLSSPTINGQPAAGVNGNIVGNPLFVNPGAGDYRLQAGSPAIDAGLGTLSPARDLDCRSRADDPSTPDSGAGSPPYVDIGAFEFAGGAVDCSGTGRYYSSLARSDFNRDGKSDIFWLHSTLTQAYEWQMNGIGIGASGSPASTGDTGWQVKGIGDFDGDGKADVFFRHSVSGATTIWLMNGTTIASSGSPGTIADLGWQVQGVGDFDGDGKADVFWMHTDGTVLVWKMNGTALGSAASPANLGPASGWAVQGIGDFNGDGKADILWKHADGTVVLWMMNGAVIASSGVVAGVGDASMGWVVQGVGDFNGDGKADILWRNDVLGGIIYVWLMNGTTITSAANVTGVGTEAGQGWIVKSIGDYDGDGKADVFWKNDAMLGGITYVWLMNGAAISSANSVTGVADFNWQVQNPK